LPTEHFYFGYRERYQAIKAQAIFNQI